MTEPEKLLIQQCLRNDRKAQLALYEHLFGLLMGMARRYYRNREDCTMHTNTAFFKMLDNLKNFSGEGSFEGWCKRIMTNTLIDEWRKFKKTSTLMKEENAAIYDLDNATFNEAEKKLGEEEVREMLFHLPEATRYVFNLFALEGYSHNEIATMANISEGTSRWHVSDARRILKGLIMQKLEVK
ncbi:MAG: RNA polymerase sigma factor [Flavobacteriales bacterium]|nr:RNA polymerase sigma factor [Flavobacteriales bacterium]